MRKKGWPESILLLLLLLLLLLPSLSACGNSGNSRGALSVASKLDVESQLLTKMYILLLRKNGYSVKEKAALANSAIIFQALQNGAIDMYPEFTATGLNTLKIPSTYDPQMDYQLVKEGFNKKYQITWLAMAPLNDGYELCTSRENAQKYRIFSLSEMLPRISQFALTSPGDGVRFVDGLKRTYHITTKSFKSLRTLDYGLSFQAVKSNKAQITVCYGTDATVPQSGFIFLKDDKNGFPAFNPAPIVRNSVLQKYPTLPNVLNPLAPKLTTEGSIQLQTDVANRRKNEGVSTARAITLVATDFLKKQRLL